MPGHIFRILLRPWRLIDCGRPMSAYEVFHFRGHWSSAAWRWPKGCRALAISKHRIKPFPGGPLHWARRSSMPCAKCWKCAICGRFPCSWRIRNCRRSSARSAHPAGGGSPPRSTAVRAIGQGSSVAAQSRRREFLIGSAGAAFRAHAARAASEDPGLQVPNRRAAYEPWRSWRPMAFRLR